MELAFSCGAAARPLTAPLPSLGAHYAALGWRLPQALAPWAAQRPTRAYLGHEFCEHLLPAAAGLRESLHRAADAGLAVSLATPLACDATLARLRRLLPLLPAGAEVVCNDWGVAALVCREAPQLAVVAGRQLCRMVKDPRLPSPRWAALYPHGLDSPAFALLLERCAVRAIEIDLPPFAGAALFEALPRPATLHAPFGYAAKGRVCRIGALAQRPPLRHAPGHACGRECRRYRADLARPAAAADLPTLQSGNTLLYGHSAAMGETLGEAAARGRVARLVLAGA